MSVRSEFRGVLSGFAVVAAGLLVAISGPLLIPGQELLGSLRFHIGVGLLAVPIALFLAGAWWRGLLMLVLVGASLGQGAWVVWEQQARRTPLLDRPAVASLDVLSINVMATNPRVPTVVDYIVGTSPDVVVVMESTAILPYLDQLSAAYPHRAGCDARGQNCDLMILSRLPILATQVKSLGPFMRLRLVTVRVEIEGRPVAIVGTHLSKPYFDEAAWFELEQVLAAVNAQDVPVIVAGDFNAAPWSEAVAGFATAGQLVPPPYYPATWPVRAGSLGVPIDNMFTRGGALIDSIVALPDSMGSNHRALRAKVRLLAAN